MELGDKVFKSTVDLNLYGSLQMEQDTFVLGLNHSGFQLNLDDDNLIWSWNEESREVTTKQAYDAMCLLFKILIIIGGISHIGNGISL